MTCAHWHVARATTNYLLIIACFINKINYIKYIFITHFFNSFEKVHLEICITEMESESDQENEGAEETRSRVSSRHFPGKIYRENFVLQLLSSFNFFYTSFAPNIFLFNPFSQ